MNVTLKICGPLLDEIRRDLARPHAFAHERVGFLTAGAASTSQGLLMLVRRYRPVQDEDYEHDPRVGARIGLAAMRKAAQSAYRPAAALLHIHTHGGCGRLQFSGVDLRSADEFVPGFFETAPRMPHVVLVLSHDSVRGRLWFAADRHSRASSASTRRYKTIGEVMTWLDRQGFLGADSDARLDQTTVGLVGLGGGNSHVAQQLAHLGIGRFVLIDDDITMLTNLNRLIGGTYADVEAGTAKVDIARRMILAINPRAHVSIYRAQWQVAAEALKSCDVIVGGLDNIRSNDELDGFCRRFLIPYIDQGMDVHRLGEADGYLVAGQVVLSSPGEPCLRCLGIVTEQALAEEARTYGDAGGKPQVAGPTAFLPRRRLASSFSL